MTQSGIASLSGLRESAACMSKNLRTALILASVAVVFFVGIVVRHWFWPTS